MELIPDLPPEALIESPPTLPAEKPAGPRLGSTLLVSVIFYAVTFGVTIPIVIVLMVMKKPLDQIMLVLAGQLVAWPAAMLAGSLICKRPWRESYAVRGFSLRLLPGVIIGCFGLSFVLNRLASAIPMPKSFESFFKGLADGDPVLTLVVISVIAPVAEELFFRGWMLRGFMANYSAKKAIWLSALMFALFHLNPWQAVVALPLGLLFGWFVLRTGSLAPGIIGHFVLNFTNTKLMLPACALFGHSPEAIKEATHLPWDVVSAGAVLSVVGIGWLWSELRLPRPSLG